MGTYCYVQLNKMKNEDIVKINLELIRMGFRAKIYGNVLYGGFYTLSQMKEDIRFMNEEEEGLKQMPHMKRPITMKDFRSLSWYKIGHFETKLSGGSDYFRLHNALIVGEWATINQDKINLDESDNYEPSFIKNYMK